MNHKCICGNIYDGWRCSECGDININYQLEYQDKKIDYIDSEEFETFENEWGFKTTPIQESHYGL